MNILVTAGTGEGPTELAAFDAALVDANVANFNLIYLSSIVPAGSTITKGRPVAVGGEWGDRLYVVMSHSQTSEPGKTVWAGLGWMQDKTGRGMFVEHKSYSEAQVSSDIRQTLGALAKNRDMQFGPVQMSLASAACKNQPVCALVVAVFESAGWSE